MKPESRWAQGKKDDVGVGSWAWLEGKGGIQLDSSPGSCQAPTILQRPIFISGCCGDPYLLLLLPDPMCSTDDSYNREGVRKRIPSQCPTHKAHTFKHMVSSRTVEDVHTVEATVDSQSPLFSLDKL